MCPPGQLISRARLQTRHGGCENSLELAQAAKALAQCPAADDDHDHFRIGNLPTRSLDRLSRYEVTLWRQACQILFTLQCLDRRKPWERLRLR